ncbi:MAG: hypothetical protein CVV61_02655 [Tenericutes bacterium HGW-Tenericutes-6]|nr:MAG: hypothetical protein CVV61_02655 [Tenericutes bacterium HGW-Tenericutes-6]
MKQQRISFKESEHVYFLISSMIFILSVIFLILGYIFVKMIESSPVILLYISTALLYYLLPHFMYGLFSFFYFQVKVKHKIVHSRAYKTFIGILTTPISAIILYTAILLLSFSQCVSE